jgi:hypothetical protein
MGRASALSVQQLKAKAAINLRLILSFREIDFYKETTNINQGRNKNSALIIH